MGRFTLGAGATRGRFSGLSALLEEMNEALNQSPAPAHEWRALQGVLGVDLLTRLLGVSPSSARRYISGRRSTPTPSRPGSTSSPSWSGT